MDHQPFVDLIMTPVSLQGCLACNTSIYKLFSENGYDVSAAANALGRWLYEPTVRALYVQMRNELVGQCFLHDLVSAFGNFEDIKFIEHFSLAKENIDSKIIAVLPYGSEPTTDCAEHVILRFEYFNTLPRRFSREDLAAFVACGNSEDGPDNYFQCIGRGGYICIDGLETCGRCFEMGCSYNLCEIWLRDDASELVDEGVIVEPLGLTKKIYEMFC